MAFEWKVKFLEIWTEEEDFDYLYLGATMECDTYPAQEDN